MALNLLLSKYRKQLMGLSMLFILIFHMGINVESINIVRSLKELVFYVRRYSENKM